MKKMSAKLIENTITTRQKDTHKGDYGRVLVIGGEENMGGAIIMTGSAAVYSGTGLVTVASHHSNKTALLTRLPEAMFVDYTDEDALTAVLSDADVVIIGPGTSHNEEMTNLLKNVLDHINEKQFLIIDGSAIGNFAKAQLSVPNDRTVFTPHVMEWQRLSGIKIEEQAIELNQEKTNQIGATIVLKGSPARIYFPNGEEIYENISGTPAQATGGMGDTLAGMIASFLGQFEHKPTALLSAVYLHSYIAEQLAKDSYVTLPSQIIKAIPTTMKLFEKNGHKTFI